MARSVSIPPRVYLPGSYEVTVDSFDSQTSVLSVSFTRTAWPSVPGDSVARVYLKWDNGAGIDGAGLPGGVVHDKDGKPLMTQKLSVKRPTVSDGKGARVKHDAMSATLRFAVLQTLTTAITVEAG